jgi:hypothetical protein
MTMRFATNQPHTGVKTMVRVVTSRYEFSHGKRPSGRGYWGFYFGGDAQPWFAPADQLYSAAKAAAITEAKRRNVSRVIVAP